MIKGRRLPEKYELAHPDDPAIDWEASAKALGLAETPQEALESAGKVKYSETKPSAVLPLTARPGEQITIWVCRPLTNRELASIDAEYGPQYDVDGIGEDGRPTVRLVRGANPQGMALAAYETAVLEVRNLDGDDVPYHIAVSIGQRILEYNRLGDDERLF